MTHRAVSEFKRARGRVTGDLRAIIDDSEDLLRAAATVSDAGFTTARKKFEEKLKDAKAALVDASQPVIDTTRETVAVADHYVHDNPWTAVGVAMAAGALLGFLAAKR